MDMLNKQNSSVSLFTKNPLVCPRFYEMAWSFFPAFGKAGTYFFQEYDVTATVIEDHYVSIYDIHFRPQFQRSGVR